jgi:hypothetical protein
MVVLSKDIKNLPPEQRIRVLKEIEEEKRKELKKKQKELEDLEKQKKKEAEDEKKEIEEAEALIRESIEDLAKEQEQAFKELEKQKARDRRVEPEESLESKIEDSPLTKTKQYTSFLEQLKEEATLYNLTNYNTYKEVGTLREKAMREGLNDKEESLLKNLKYKLEEAEGNSMYKERDSQEGNYFSRLSKAISQIEDIQKDIDKRTKETMYSSK